VGIYYILNDQGTSDGVTRLPGRAFSRSGQAPTLCVMYVLAGSLHCALAAFKF
jgi:hypothetical protein